MQGLKGPFISFPATKKADGNGYWNHVWGDAKFQSAVMQMVDKAKPVQRPAPAPRAAPAKGSGFEDMNDDIPF
jgi:hypothetical protein